MKTLQKDRAFGIPSENRKDQANRNKYCDQSQGGKHSDPIFHRQSFHSDRMNNLSDAKPSAYGIRHWVPLKVAVAFAISRIDWPAILVLIT